MECLFCGSEMAPGWVAVKGVFPLQAWDTALIWEPAEIRTTKRRWRDIGRRGWVPLLTGRLVRRRERGAYLCHVCGAVMIDPDRPYDDPPSG
jgi:hypothetical protein